MRKLMLLTVVALAFFVAVPKSARSGPYSVEPCLKSKLCAGLVEHFSFEESSDSARYGAFGTPLLEVPTYNLPNTAGKIGNAASFGGTAASDWLWSSTFVPNMSSGWSMSFWFRPTAIPSTDNDYQVLFSRSATGNLGTSVVIEKYAGSGNVYLCVYQIDRNASTVGKTCKDTPLANNTTYFGAVGVGDADDAPGNTQEWVSVNASAKMSNSIGFFPWSGISQFRVGQEPRAARARSGRRRIWGGSTSFRSSPETSVPRTSRSSTTAAAGAPTRS